ncbi:MAG: CHAT domain-containing protein [Pirellulales bacterium]
MPPERPVILTAFANDRVDGVRYLRNLPEEQRRLRRALAVASELCEHVTISNATLAELVDALQTYRNRVAVFHYAGHANSYQLLLESTLGAAHRVEAAGLAQLLGRQQGLQLVFLNGCSTEQQADDLIAAGVPCVIATTQAIDDRLATDLSERFYKGIAGGASLATAFAESVAEARAAGTSTTRLLASLDDELESDSKWDGAADGTPAGAKDGADAGRFPWLMRTAPGAERAGEWNLPLAADNPLYGLPALPQQELPESPYRSLQWFRREDADIFFGRGREVRDLFQLVTASSSPPIVLFYGLSGVGKSSVLDAGLLPRLESVAEAAYVRRDAQLGLSGTLRRTLAVQGAATVCDAWTACEQRRGRPLTVILDQVEEAFTRPLPGVAHELREFVELLGELFANPVTRPRGRIVLGFRKEWFAELDARLSEARLPRSKVFLERLDRRGVIEIVSGPARSPRLKQQYRLSVEPGLAEIIADDLLADPGAPVAPTLQILLTRLWNEARRASPDAPRIDAPLYQALQRHGILLGDFLRQQLEMAEQRMPQAARSGFLLDLLAAHTTDLGTSAQLARDELAQWYDAQARSGLLDEVLRLCQEAYLLSQLGRSAEKTESRTSLMHDTLAPLVRERHDKSDLPGQRARRILDSRGVEWVGGKQGSTLDAADLRVVEEGREGTRNWTADEQRLIEASRRLQAKVERQRRLLRYAGAAFMVALAASSLFAWIQMGAAERSARDARDQKTKAETNLTAAQNASERAEAAARDAAEQRTKAFQAAAEASAQATSAGVTRATMVRERDGDYAAAASHFAAVADIQTEAGPREMLRNATASTLRGVQLTGILESSGIIFDVMPLEGQRWCVWSGSAMPPRTRIVIDSFERGSAQVVLDLEEPSAQVFVTSDQRSIVRVSRGAAGLVVDRYATRTATWQRMVDFSLEQAESATGSSRAEAGRGEASSNHDWIVAWTRDRLQVVDLKAGKTESYPLDLDVVRASIADDGKWVWLLPREGPSQVWRWAGRGRHEFFRQELSFVPNAQVRPAGQGWLVVMHPDQRLVLHHVLAGMTPLELPELADDEFRSFQFVLTESANRLFGYSKERILYWNLSEFSHSVRATAGPAPAVAPAALGYHVVGDYRGTAQLTADRKGTVVAITGDSAGNPSRQTLKLETLAVPEAEWSYAEAAQKTLELEDPSPVSGMVFSADGASLVVWTSNFVHHPNWAVSNIGVSESNGAVFQIDVATGAQRGVPLRHRLAMQGARFSPSGREVLTWAADGQVRRWIRSPTPDVEPLGDLAPADLVRAASRDGRRLATIPWRNTRRIEVLDVESGETTTLPDEFETVLDVSFAEDPTQLFVSQPAGVQAYADRGGDWRREESAAYPDDWGPLRTLHGNPLRVLGAVADEQLAALFPEPAPLWGVQCDSPSGRFLAWGDRTLQLGEAPAGREKSPPRLIWKATLPTSIDRAFFATERRLVIAASNDGFFVLDAETGRLKQGPLGRSGLEGLSVSRDGKRMLEWGGAGAGINSLAGGYVVSWDLETLAPDSPVLRHPQLVKHAEYSDDQLYVASSTGYANHVGATTVHVWSRELGVEVAPPLGRSMERQSNIRFLKGRRELIVWSASAESRAVRWNWGEASRDLPASKLSLEVARRTGSRLNRFQDYEFLSRAEWEALPAPPGQP